MNMKVTMTLREWLESPSVKYTPLSYREKMLLWKGLFLYMWKLDLPSLQQEMAEHMASFVHCFHEKDESLQFYYSFLKVMDKQWVRIDKFHTHKFVMLLGRITTQCFIVLSRNDWDGRLIRKLNDHVADIISSGSIGFLTKFIAIYLDELAKITTGKISISAVTYIMLPFRIIVVNRRQHADYRIVGHTMKHLFDVILHQSDSGRAFIEKFEEWKSTTNDDVDQDLRAAHVDVVDPEIHFYHEDLIEKMEKYIREPTTDVKFGHALRKLIDSYLSFVQEQTDFEMDLNQPAVNKRKKTTTHIEVPLKRVKSKVENLKPKKKSLHGNSFADSDKENVITVSYIWNPVVEEGKAEFFNFIFLFKFKFIFKDNNQPTSSSAPLRAANPKKKVQIMEQKNRSQCPWEYLLQLRISPKNPFNSEKKPGKGLLKPNIRL